MHTDPEFPPIEDWNSAFDTRFDVGSRALKERVDTAGKVRLADVALSQVPAWPDRKETSLVESSTLNVVNI